MTTLQDRLNEWKKQLLDLSKRNRLLHFRETKRQTLRLDHPDIATVFKRIAIDEKPLTVAGLDPRSLLDLEQNTEGDQPAPKPAPAVKRNEVSFAGTLEGAAKALYTLRSRSKTEREERGVGVLYLAFGFLHWFEDENSDYEIVSPIVLVPVDLERDAALEPYRLVSRDDDIVINPTLRKVLEDEFRIKLPDLPDEDNWAIRDYLEAVRKKVSRQSRWQLDDAAYLSLFSFMKLNMYRDLESGLAIAQKSPLLQALAGDLSLLASTCGDIHEIPADELDERVNPEQCLQVLDADSSQQQAIELAKAGGSFVLQGPPGTGKSQTIANIIAELLGQGKSVLFVSEKAAALDVVHRRLTAVGLADACLALHSHKANKRDVVAELARVYSLGNATLQSGPTFNFERLRDRRNALNAYVRELHTPRNPLGKSVFQVEGMVSQLADTPFVPFEVGEVVELTSSRLETLRDAVARLAGSVDTITSIELNLWRGAVIDGRSLEVKRVTVESLKTVGTSCSDAASSSALLAARLGLDAESITPARVTWMIAIARAIVAGPDFRGEWLSRDRLPSLMESERDAAIQHRAAVEEGHAINEVFLDDVLEHDLEGLSDRLKQEYRSVFSHLGSGYRQEMRVLASLTRSGKRPKHGDVERLVPVAIRLRDRRKSIELSRERLVEQFGSWYQAYETDWTALETALAWAFELSGSFGGSAPDAFADRVATVLSDRESLRADAAQAEASAEAAMASLRMVATWFIEGAPEARRLVDASAVPLLDIARNMGELAASIEDLATWTRLASAVDECVRAGLKDPTDALASSGLAAEEYVDALEKRVLTLWLDHWMGTVPILRDFDASSHAHLIQEFRRLDSDLKKTARRTLANKLAARRPHPAAASMNLASSQPGLLMKEARKMRRHKPLRVLFSEIPELLVAIKPCMMMSPLSVGQFLPLDKAKFDAVVFDEASQVKPEDAIGAIMRGKQVMVVGDSKQLPPTSFFDVSMSDDFDEDDYYDDDSNAFESILDLCGTVGLPERMLEWHYRSRREGLIAFSNNFLYDNRLVTFPSPDFDGASTGVEFKHVADGVYDRSRTRTNAREVQEIVEIVRTHANEHPDKSLGVVAFSQAQMTAIDTALWRLRGDDPALEAFFGNMNEEPFFVKNLENVQGDERDVIVFSVGYGRDATGTLRMNFGPLNNRGGERRLNVAVTRAREKVTLVSSIRGADIDLGRTNAEGVRLLKHYLDYAERGVDALDAVCSVDDDAEYGSLFEEQVANVLRANGYRVVKQVGCSGYRIDLAIIHPDRPGQYAVGIECDGASYHSAATARERDRLREEVLVGLGWRLHRIWSTDWFRARPREVEKLLGAVEAAIEGHEVGPRAPVPTGVVFSHARPKEMQPTEPEPVPSIPQPSMTDHLAVMTEPYVESRPASQHSDFYESPQAVLKVLLSVVAAEAPLHIDVATRRVAKAWDMDRSGSRIKAVVQSAIQNAKRQGEIAVRGDFLYGSETGPLRVRRNVAGGSSRKAGEIAPEEIAEAARLVLQDQLTLTTDDLLVATARILGFERKGSGVHAAMEKGVRLLVKSGAATSHQGVVTLA